MTVASSEPGTVTSTSAQAMAVETTPVTANRMRNSMKGSGSLLPALSTPLRILSVSPVFAGGAGVALMGTPRWCGSRSGPEEWAPDGTVRDGHGGRAGGADGRLVHRPPTAVGERCQSKKEGTSIAPPACANSSATAAASAGSWRTSSRVAARP